MTETACDKWTTTPPSQISAPDALFSSDINKRIRRSFFKKDVAVKSYKCDFHGSDAFTAAKVYVSNSAFYVVHRPKRRKLTTISFSAIRDIKSRTDEQGVDIHLENRLVYTLTNFQRPEAAIAFLLNFWNLVRKNKYKFTSPSTTSFHSGLENSGSTGRFSTTSCDARLSILSSDASPRLLKAPTTISLNSTASVSETGSLDERCRLSVSSNDHGSQLNRVGHVAEDLAARRPNESPSIVRQSVNPVTRTPDRSGSSSFITSQSKKADPDQEVTQHSAVTPFLRAETTEVCLTPQAGPLLPNGPATLLGTGQQALHSASNGRPKPVARLTESPGWSATWPLSFLPYPFSSPPQRLTMLIAYAILAFLLLSTLHLYHRLAVFDLHGGPSLTRTTHRQLNELEYRAGLEFLEEQLIQLVNLMGQLTKSLVKLTTELRSLDPIGDRQMTMPPAETIPPT